LNAANNDHQIEAVESITEEGSETEPNDLDDALEGEEEHKQDVHVAKQFLNPWIVGRVLIQRQQKGVHDDDKQHKFVELGILNDTQTSLNYSKVVVFVILADLHFLGLRKSLPKCLLLAKIWFGGLRNFDVISLDNEFGHFLMFWAKDIIGDIE
jgi:hypothetical protein